MRTVATAIGTALLTAVVALAWSFAPRTLPISTAPLGPLPHADPPAGMSVSALPTGRMRSKAAFAFRGGSFTDSRDFTMTAILVRHPRGDLLIDTGYGRRVDEQMRTLPWIMRALSSYQATAPAAEQLARAGYDVATLAGVLITHAHWDHVSGLPELPRTLLWMNADERRFVDGGAPMASVLRSFGRTDVREYRWDGGPYLGFPRSHDFHGDGAVVLVPAPGHTPGSIVVFLSLPSGARYALVGDLVWQREGIDLPAERPWLSRRLVDEDPAEVRRGIARMAAVHACFPEIVIVPAHDARAAASGRLVRWLEGHAGEVVAAGFSPDGRTALTGGTDNAALLFNVMRGASFRADRGGRAGTGRRAAHARPEHLSCAAARAARDSRIGGPGRWRGVAPPSRSVELNGR